jgi:hypothetical protein
MGQLPARPLAVRAMALEQRATPSVVSHHAGAHGPTTSSTTCCSCHGPRAAGDHGGGASSEGTLSAKGNGGVSAANGTPAATMSLSSEAWEIAGGSEPSRAAATLFAAGAGQSGHLPA